MNRRSFLKRLSATTAVAFIPLFINTRPFASTKSPHDLHALLKEVSHAKFGDPLSKEMVDFVNDDPLKHGPDVICTTESIINDLLYLIEHETKTL